MEGNMCYLPVNVRMSAHWVDGMWICIRIHSLTFMCATLESEVCKHESEVYRGISRYIDIESTECGYAYGFTLSLSCVPHWRVRYTLESEVYQQCWYFNISRRNADRNHSQVSTNLYYLNYHFTRCASEPWHTGRPRHSVTFALIRMVKIARIRILYPHSVDWMLI